MKDDRSHRPRLRGFERSSLGRCPGAILAGLATTLALGACAEPEPELELEPEWRMVIPMEVSLLDDQGASAGQIEIGTTVQVSATGLTPDTLYELRLGIGGRADMLDDATSFARVASDGNGTIDPLILWYTTGVVGCAATPAELAAPQTFVDFASASAALVGETIHVTVHPVDGDPTDPGSAVGRAITSTSAPIVGRTSPLLYVSDAAGCPLNGAVATAGELYVTGQGFAPTGPYTAFLSEARHVWQPGDPLQGGTSIVLTPDAAGQIPTTPLWSASEQIPGLFDLVIRPGTGSSSVFESTDLAPYADTSLGMTDLLPNTPNYPMDLAGRPINFFPHFIYTDAFSTSSGNVDTVRAALEPTRIPEGHSGGLFAAYYVVPHRNAPTWNGAAQDLVDVSGLVEIAPVKAGSRIMSSMPVWSWPATPGEYDVVVDFGAFPAATPLEFVGDGEYDLGQDFLDGGARVGFHALDNPYDQGPYAVGTLDYDDVDYFAAIPSTDPDPPVLVDFRATVRYPATAVGVETPVVPGQHPVFLIMHANATDYCLNPGEDKASCTDRIDMHLGHVALLERLASWGIIAISVDAYDLLGPLWEAGVWIEERAWLNQRHLELWSHMGDGATYPGYTDYSNGLFTGKVDTTRVMIAGHSRGATAAITTALNNTDFDIRAVASIAPIDTAEEYELDDVPYLAVISAADGDVGFQDGAALYHRAGSSLGYASEKSMVYLDGANHAFFSEVWGQMGFDDSLFNRLEKLTFPEQLELGNTYVTAFARLHLLGDSGYRGLFSEGLVHAELDGFRDRIHLMHHEPDHLRIADASTGTYGAAGGASVLVDAPIWSVDDDAYLVSWSVPGLNFVDPPRVSFSLPGGPTDLSGYDVLSLRACKDANSNLEGPLSFHVRLHSAGETSMVRVSGFGGIRDNYRWTEGGNSINTVPFTIRIPLDVFEAMGGVDLTTVDAVELVFNDYPYEGAVYIDDIVASQ